MNDMQMIRIKRPMTYGFFGKVSGWWDIPYRHGEVCNCGLIKFFEYPKDTDRAVMCFTKRKRKESYLVELDSKEGEGHIKLDGWHVFILDYAYRQLKMQVNQGYKYVSMEYYND